MTTPQLAYIIGIPGAGKSTLVAELTSVAAFAEGKVGGVAVVHYWDPADPVDLLAIELGRRRESFSGTDALSMSVLPRALDALAALADSGPRFGNVFAEGDRLATLKFFIGARDRGYDVTVVHLDVSPATGEFRRAERGSSQNVGWLRGRITKTANLAVACRDAGFPVVTVSGEDTAAEVVGSCAAVPVLGRFTEKVS